ncbi:MAG: DUF2905 domain-containing protein [Candidatus Nanoarchaeia archaeon]
MKTGNFLVIIGVVILVLGILWNFGIKPFHLPGDIIIDKENVKIYIPIATMLLLSLLFSLGFALYRLF